MSIDITDFTERSFFNDLFLYQFIITTIRYLILSFQNNSVKHILIYADKLHLTCFYEYSYDFNPIFF